MGSPRSERSRNKHHKYTHKPHPPQRLSLCHLLQRACVPLLSVTMPHKGKPKKRRRARKSSDAEAAVAESKADPVVETDAKKRSTKKRRRASGATVTNTADAGAGAGGAGAETSQAAASADGPAGKVVVRGMALAVGPSWCAARAGCVLTAS